jgi:hypothetical protein
MKTPTAFHPSAQGCRVREATLGRRSARIANPERVASSGERCAATPLGLRSNLNRRPRVARSSQPWAESHCPVGANPIRPIDFGVASERADHDALVGLVERILTAKRASPSADTTALEREIGARVYRLYALTPDEIKLVEEAKP